MDLLWTLVVIFLLLWVLGISFVPAVGSLIHLLLVIAIIIIAVRLLRGQSV